MILLKTSRFLVSFLIICLAFIGCSRKEAGQREHILRANVHTDLELALSGKSLEFKEFLDRSDMIGAFKFIIDPLNINDDEFIRSQMVIDNFQRIVDSIYVNGVMDSGIQDKLLLSVNENCVERFSDCNISYLVKLDSRLYSALIAQIDNITSKQVFLDHLFSSNYHGQDKWKLLTRIIINEETLNLESYKPIYLNALASSPEVFKGLVGTDELVLKLFPKKIKSWYFYIKSMQEMEAITDEVFSALIKRAIDETNDKICKDFDLNKLKLEEHMKIDCDLSSFQDKYSMRNLLTNEMAIGVPLSSVTKNDSLDHERVRKYLLYRGLSLMEESLLLIHEYIEEKFSAGLLPTDFLFRLQEKIDVSLKLKWSIFFKDVEQAGGIMFLQDDNIKTLKLVRQFHDFFFVALELSSNLIVATKVVKVGHTEVLNFGRVSVFVNADTISKQLFGGRMDGLISFFEANVRQLSDPLKVLWSFEFMKKFGVQEIFSSSFETEFKEMFRDAVEEDYQRFSSGYELYKRSREKMPLFHSMCRGLKTKNYAFSLDMSDVMKNKSLRLATGLVSSETQSPGFEAFFKTYMFNQADFFIPELLEIYRSEFYPKAIIRNVMLGDLEANKHPIETKVKELITEVESDIKAFDNCFGEARDIESKIAAIVVEKEIEFAEKVKIDLEKLNLGEITKSDILNPAISHLRGLSSWNDFFIDLNVKYGFQEDNDRYSFSDSPLLQLIRIFHYIKSSEFGQYYDFNYDSYFSVAKKIEVENTTLNINPKLKKYNGIEEAEKFFLTNLNENFKILEFRESMARGLVRLNYIKGAIQKVDFEASDEKTFERFEESLTRSQTYIRDYALQEWEKKLITYSDVECPSCGSNEASEGMVAPDGFLASIGYYGDVRTERRAFFPWGPLDSYFQILVSRDLGYDADINHYMTYTPGFIRDSPEPSAPSGPGQGGFVDAESMFTRENPWGAAGRVVHSAHEIDWSSIIDFGEESKRQISKVIKFDLTLMQKFRDYVQMRNQEVEFETYNFSILHKPYTPEELVSPYLWGDYDQKMQDFHRETLNFYKLEN